MIRLPTHITHNYHQIFESQEGIPELNHIFSQDEIHAVNAALAAGRPLLVRGEPGVGKTQLARAAAVALKRAFVSFVVDIRTESTDLLWHFDAVKRLADAQLLGALKGLSPENLKALGEELAVERYVHPRPVWWGFNWKSAEDRAKAVGIKRPPQPKGVDPEGEGCVILIDEIDKAETDVPNGLLEAMGSLSFQPPGELEPVMVSGPPPLVIITTNEERALPHAFVRRCLVLHMNLPEGDEALRDHLVKRAVAHFGEDEVRDDDESTLYQKAADLLIRDRRKADENHWLPLPGQAEYLDMIRAVRNLEPYDIDKQRSLLDAIGRFSLKKHPGAVS